NNYNHRSALRTGDLHNYPRRMNSKWLNQGASKKGNGSKPKPKHKAPQASPYPNHPHPEPPDPQPQQPNIHKVILQPQAKVVKGNVKKQTDAQMSLKMPAAFTIIKSQARIKRKWKKYGI